MAEEKDKTVQAFRSAWRALFTTSAHLDSVLSKVPAEVKSEVARAMQAFLRRPVSEAHRLGISLETGAPWTVEVKALPAWPTAVQFFGAFRGSSQDSSIQGVQEDFPPWLLAQWETDWGAEVSRRLVHELARNPPLTLRASRRANVVQLIQQLRDVFSESREERGEIQVAPRSPFGISLSAYAPVLRSEAYRQGMFEIQDEGSQLMAFFSLWPEVFGNYLTPLPASLVETGAEAGTRPEKLRELGSLTVVDACSGAGGKALALADALQGRGRVHAYDISPGKIAALKKRAARAGLRNIQATVVEENREEEVVKRFRRRADVVLVDAPCSGWGVLRRNPDIKWRPDVVGMGRMPGLQKRILSAYSDLVAAGGSLVYGVCTFRKAETSDNVSWFLERHPDFIPREGGFLGPGGHRGGMDGFFMQRFERVKGNSR